MKENQNITIGIFENLNIFSDSGLIYIRQSIDKLLEEREIRRSKEEEVKKKVQSRFSVEEIRDKINAYFREDLSVECRNEDIIFLRSSIFYILNKHYGYSLVNIGKAYGGRKHSTVNNAISKATNFLSNPSINTEFWEGHLKIREFLNKLLFIEIKK